MCLVVDGGNRTDVHEHRAAGKREGVDFLLSDHVELEGPGAVGRNRCGEAFAQRFDVFGLGTGVREDGHLRVDLTGDLQAELLLLVAAHAGLAGVGQFRCGDDSKTLRGHKSEG